MNNRPLGAQLSHMLKDRGVEVIFGIPGVHNQEMYRGIEEAGLTHVLARHEQGAGFMADGYARATGRPGVCYVITGPGVCNIMTPMGQAYSDSVPMLVISSCLDETSATRGQLHQMRDQEGAARTVCDWSETARSPQAAYHLIDRALAEFETARPRPKHLSVPIALLQGNAPEWVGAGPEPSRPAPDTAAVVDVARALTAAKRPLILLGGGARAGATAARWVAKATGAAVISTYAGRGIVPDAYALNFGPSLARAGSADLIASADLVLVIGSALAEVDLWRADLGNSVPLIRVDIDPEILSSGPQAAQAIAADAAAFLTALAEVLTNATPAKGWTEAEVGAARARWRAEVATERPHILPIAQALRDVLPEETLIYSDMTQFAYAAKEVFPLNHPGLWHHPYGFGTLGYAMPAAIGGKIGVGDRPVVAIAGDYGFQYTMQELMVAVELELCLPILLWDNGKLGEIEDSMVRAQIAPNAVIQKNPDFLKLAEAYGAASAAPRSLADFKAAMTKALAHKGPTIVHVTPETCA